MSEYQGNYDSIKSQSYPFTGSAPPMGENDYFALKPTPEGMEPIVDPDTKMCIGYDDKHGYIYDFEGKLAHTYIYDPPLEEPWFSPDDLIGLAGPTLVKKTIVPAARAAGRVMDRVANAALNKAYTTMHFAKRKVTDPATKALRIRENRLKAKKQVLEEGKEWNYPTNIQISKCIIAAPITFLLKSRLKMGLSAKTLKFEEAAMRHMSNPKRYVPTEILEKAIRYGIPSKDQSNRGFGLMYKMYNIVVSREGSEEIRILEVLVDESTWTIKHFLYQEEKKFWRSIPNKAAMYRQRSIFERPFIKDMSEFQRKLNQTKDLNIKLPKKE